MRKTKKALASLAIAGMVLSMAPMSVFGATDVTRLSDADRVGTAIAIAANGWTSADNVIVVPADDANIVDALAAAPLAGQLNAPILVTYKGALDPKVQQKIVDLKAKNVYAVGALSADTVASLKAISGVNVTALQGADRTETAAKVAAQLTNIKGSFVVAYNGVADAMSAASYAAANGYSILVENPDGTLPTNEAAYKGAKQYTVGGQAKLDGATALAGADRYATNDAVVKALDYKYDKVYVANGESLVDALAGASLAAKTNSPIVLANATKAATGVNDKVTASTQVIALGGVGAVPESVRTQVGKQAPTGTVSVQSVKATSASSIKVVFSAAPADTTKVTFTIARGTTPVVATATWNDAKTEATLTTSYSMPEGTYTVGVKNDTTDLGTTSLDITQQKVAKITFTSTKLAIAQNGKGYASYKVFDQYDNDITTSYLANAITFNTGAGTFDKTSNGLLILSKGSQDLITFPNIVISASDSNSGTTATATLTTSTALGTLADLRLNKLTNADNKVLTDGDTTSVFYIDYTATDLSGNETKDYNLVVNGLVNGALTSSYDIVSATVEHDPADNNKAVIQVQAKYNATPLQMDMPVSITAMTFNGTSSTLNTTLKKSSQPDSVTLMAPSYEIAVNEQKEIPFEVYDQDGVKLTKFADINGKVTFSGASLYENVDGTARLVVDTTGAVKGAKMVSATTQTGKLSTITLNIVDAAKADSLSVNTNQLISAMQAGAIQKLDNGYSKGGITVKDQYGRAIDFREVGNNALGNRYVVVPSSTTLGVISATGYAAPGANQIVITAVSPGTATVKFDLVDTTATGYVSTSNYPSTAVVNSQSVTMSVIKNDDITDYMLSPVTSPIYAVSDATTGGAVTAMEDAYAAGLTVYGKTSTGTKVLLADTYDANNNPIGGKVVDAYLDNNTDFVLDQNENVFRTSQAMSYGTSGNRPSNAIRVVAKKLGDTVSDSSTNVTVTFIGADGKYHAASTQVKSTKTAPTINTLNMNVATEKPGVTVNSRGDVVTIDSAAAGAGFTSLFAAGKSMVRFDQDENIGTFANTSGTANGYTGARAAVYFYATDSYGTKAGSIVQVTVTKVSGTGNFNVDAKGNVTGALAVGDVYNITAVTSNGLMSTIELDVK